MTINIKPKTKKTDFSDFQNKHKTEAATTILSTDKVKISVDIDSELYFKIMELKLETKKTKKINLKIKDIVTKALHNYFDNL